MQPELKRKTSLFLVFFLLSLLVTVGTVQAAPEETISVSMHHYILQPGSKGMLDVKEIVVVNNQGAEIAAGAGKVKFVLPEGYQDLIFAGGTEQLVEAKGQELVVTAAVPKGESTYRFGYLLPAGAAPHFILKHRLPYPTETLFVLTPLQGVSVSSTKLVDGGVSQEQQARIYMADNLPAGEQVDMVVTLGAGAAAGGVTQPPPNPKFHNPGHIRLWYQSPFKGINAHLFMVMVIGVPLAGLIYYVFKRRQMGDALKAKGDPEEEMFHRLMAREKVLLQKIGELDEKRANQEVDEDTYRQLREAYKKKLVNVKAQLKEFTG
ncbi:hypothetical protein SY88_09440 [Clostridiales bacterium PH28_bin88]|nr:hypothetical protein SY88_09440 [Clostridiales bacterium PH28_bin88]